MYLQDKDTPASAIEIIHTIKVLVALVSENIRKGGGRIYEFTYMYVGYVCVKYITGNNQI